MIESKPVLEYQEGKEEPPLIDESAVVRSVK